MRLREFVLEGYGEAQTEFATAAGDAASVQKTIQSYRDLVNKNQVKGLERNIDHWRKQGWEKFNQFVNQAATQPTPTAIKRQRVPGKSINLIDNAQWLVVVPLDKEASCFHGRGSDWCTAKPNQNHFEQYFYDNKVTLIYCVNKQTGNMWAIAAHMKKNQIELFTQQDKSLTPAQFKQQTALDPVQIRNLAFEKQHIDPITATRSSYQQAIAQLPKLMSTTKKAMVNRAEIEKLLLYTKNTEMSNLYISRVGGAASEPIQLAAVRRNGSAIRLIKNPSEPVQLAAVRQEGHAIRFINDPSEPVQLAAVRQEGYALGSINDPSLQVQLAAMDQDGSAIGFIKNPSEPVQLAAVRQDGHNIRFIKLPDGIINPSEPVQLAAVGSNGYAISYIKNPSLQVQLAAMRQEGSSIRFIKNPSEPVQLAAMRQNGHAIAYIKNPSTAVRFINNTRLVNKYAQRT